MKKQSNSEIIDLEVSLIAKPSSDFISLTHKATASVSEEELINKYVIGEEKEHKEDEDGSGADSPGPAQETNV